MTAALLALLLAQAQPATGYTPQEAAALFAEANDAYYKGDYEGARTRYEKLLTAGLGGPDVLFNLGTSHLAAGELGPAVLYLERARRLARDDDIEANLALARQKQADQVVGADAEEPFLQRLSDAVDERAVSLGFLATWYLGFALLLVFRRRAGGPRVGVGLAAGGTFTLALAFGALVAAHVWVSQTVVEAVVQPQTARVREFPGDSARVSFEVHAGLKVRVMEEAGRYVRVRLPNRLEGWTEKEGVVEL